MSAHTLPYATVREDMADAASFIEHSEVSLSDSLGCLTSAQRGLEWVTGRQSDCAELLKDAEALIEKARKLRHWIERGCNQGEQ
jgi:hypothetical protein